MAALDVTPFIPMLKAPESWPTWLVGAVAMVALAVLDVIGALAAKEWATTSGLGPLILGAAAFLALFWVYASALQYAELALVTMGWIVMLQVGLLLIDRFHYGVQLAPGKWVAVVVILVAQGYLLIGPSAEAEPVAADRLGAITVADQQRTDSTDSTDQQAA